MKKLQKRAKVAPYLSKKLTIQKILGESGKFVYEVQFRQSKSFWSICQHASEDAAKFCRRKLIHKLRLAASRRTRS